MSLEDSSLARAWRTRDLDFALGPHFTVGELVHSSTGAAHAVDNWPDSVARLAALRELVDHVLEPLRGKFGIVRVTSGYRSPAVNLLVGGAPDSQHLAGEAADIVCPAIDCAGLAAWIEQALPFDQLILEGPRQGRAETPWVHVSWSARVRRHEALTRLPDGSYGRGLRDIGGH